MRIYCQMCEVEVASAAAPCPHCGQQFFEIDTQPRGVLHNNTAAISFGVTLAVIVIVAMCFRRYTSVRTPGLDQPAARIAAPVVPPPVDATRPRAAVLQVLTSGDGHDWLTLSDRDRLQLGFAIQKRLDVAAEPYDIKTFIQTFYDQARADNVALLSKPVSEVAAAAGVMLQKQ